MPPTSPRRPETDWTCREVLDALSSESGVNGECVFCGRRLRWVHILVHQDYACAAGAGCCCAARLCYGYDAEAAEREMIIAL